MNRRVALSVNIIRNLPNRAKVEKVLTAVKSHIYHWCQQMQLPHIIPRDATFVMSRRQRHPITSEALLGISRNHAGSRLRLGAFNGWDVKLVA